MIKKRSDKIDIMGLYHTVNVTVKAHRPEGTFWVLDPHIRNEIS